MAMIGKTLGHYRVGGQLGRADIGEDLPGDEPSLDRKIALKFLPDVFQAIPKEWPASSVRPSS
jgi:hypothetical protein